MFRPQENWPLGWCCTLQAAKQWNISSSCCNAKTDSATCILLSFPWRLAWATAGSMHLERQLGSAHRRNRQLSPSCAPWEYPVVKNYMTTQTSRSPQHIGVLGELVVLAHRPASPPADARQQGSGILNASTAHPWDAKLHLRLLSRRLSAQDAAHIQLRGPRQRGPRGLHLLHRQLFHRGPTGEPVCKSRPARSRPAGCRRVRQNCRHSSGPSRASLPQSTVGGSGPRPGPSLDSAPTRRRRRRHHPTCRRWRREHRAPMPNSPTRAMDTVSLAGMAMSVRIVVHDQVAASHLP